MKLLHYPRDRSRIEKLFLQSARTDPKVEKVVRSIIAGVRRRGDRAVAEYTKKFDGLTVAPPRFKVPPSRLKRAWDDLPFELRKAMKIAHDRIMAYHRRQMIAGFTYRDRYGNRMDERVFPIPRVGICIPGAAAPLFSTVLMGVAPARAAGVDEIVLVTAPPPRASHQINPIFAAAWLAGAHEVLAIGGAQAIAALALGTQTIRPVDKIVGPGNAYVAMAKRLLFGKIDIDMIAGPTEILILADRSASPCLVAADLLAQAEHSDDAQAIVLLIGEYDIEALQSEVKNQTAAAPRRDIIRRSLRARGAIIRVRTAGQAIELAERKSPEHLEILTRAPRSIARRVRNAGAIFIGPSAPVPIGDYVAGPNHTLPTGGAARFSSPLSVRDFLKTSHVIECTRRGFDALAGITRTLAEGEGLFAHAEAVRRRQG